MTKEQGELIMMIIVRGVEIERQRCENYAK